jgi:integrase
MWSILERKKTFSELLIDDFNDYFKFLANPPGNWMSNARVPRGAPGWAPLRSPLAKDAVRHAHIIVNTLISWLVDARYLKGNPVTMLGREKVSNGFKNSRYLPMQTWEFFWDWLGTWPEITLAERRNKLRTQVLFSILYVTAARLADISQAAMGDLEQDDDGFWWWRVVGKGNKKAMLAITPELLEWIKQYRLFYGLAALPSPGEKTSLFFKRGGPSETKMDDSSVYYTVKTVMAKAAVAAELDGRSDIAARLRAASTHWMRHTALTHQAQSGMPLVTIRDNARHKSIATTSRYLNDDNKLRHQENREYNVIRKTGKSV